MRLIDADELLTAFPVDDEPTLTKSCVRMTIQHMPTIEPQPEPEDWEWCHDCKEYDHELHCCHRWNKVIRETVEELKQAQPDWIPVAERLPEDEQPVLFSIKTGRVHQGKYYNDGSMNQWYSALDKMRAFNNVVNAWMPLPKPWKGDMNEQTD